ncbi:MAG: hypothetical protein ACYDH3_02700 [Candidatus Aminicenantales bacterium]
MIEKFYHIAAAEEIAVFFEAESGGPRFRLTDPIPFNRMLPCFASGIPSEESLNESAATCGFGQ